MEIVFLGTSSGVPTKRRNVSATAIKKASTKRWCLVDCGEATQHQLLHTRLSLNALEAICITHVHGDHCYGLPGLLASANMSGRTNPLNIVAPRPIENLLSTLIEVTELRLGFSINFIPVETLTEPFSLHDFLLNAHELSHRVPSYAYSFTESSVEPVLDQDKLRAAGIAPGPIWGRLQQGQDIVLDNGIRLNSRDFLRQNRTPRKLVVAGDNDKPALLLEACKRADLLIHEATYTDEILRKVGKEPGHSSASMVARFAEQCGLRNLILTHFSPRFGYGSTQTPCIQDVENEARRNYSGNAFLANDFDVYGLDRSGVVKKLVNS